MNKQELKYWSLIVVLSYVPTVLIHLAFRSMWYKGVDSSTSATTIEMMITMFALPLYLGLMNYYLSNRIWKMTSAIFINGLIMISCVWLSSYLHFKNWADSTGGWSNPDSETLEVMKFEKIVGTIVCIAVLVIIFFYKNQKQKTDLIP